MEKRLKVLILLDGFSIGKSSADRAVDNYAKCLQNFCNVTVASTSAEFQDYPYRVVVEGSCAKLYRVLNKEKFDIIHIHSTGKIMDMAIKLAKIKKIPIVATIYSNVIAKIEANNNKLMARIKKGKYISKLNELSEVFVASPYVAEDLRENGFRGKVSYLPLGSDLKAQESKSELAKIANHYFNLTDKDNVLITLGNVRLTKRIDFVLRALRLVAKAGVKFKYFVIGGGEEIPHLQTLSKELKIDRDVCFLGYTKDELMNPLISRADLLLYPSTYDYYGVAKIECAGLGTAGVYIKDSFVANEVFDNINGFIALNSVEDYAKTIVDALKDKTKLKVVGKTATKDLYVNWVDCSNMLLNRITGIVAEHNYLSKKIKANDKKVRKV